MVNMNTQLRKYSKSASQAAMDDQLTLFEALTANNDDLLTEVLLRLPATSILRFKSVSKHWRSLLSHRSFTLRFDKLSKSPGIFVRNVYVPFDVENRSPPPFRSLDFYPDHYGIKIVHSCNGLLLCCSDQVPHYARRYYYVYNPTTKQFAIIPPVPGGEAVCKTVCFMGLAFHQTDCVHYKVICIRALEPVGETYQIQVYSSHTGEWKISIQSFSVRKSRTESWFVRKTFRNGVYWNGAFHWLPCLRDNLYLKIDVEQLHSLALPAQMMASETRARYIGESRGHLHLVQRKYRRPHSLHLNIYEMLSDHSGWFLKYQVELDELLHAFPGMTNRFDYTFEVIDVVRCEKDEDTFLVLEVPSGQLKSLITYNVHDSSFKEIFTYPINYYDELPTFHRYTETLTSF